MSRQPTIPLIPVSRRGFLGALVAGAGVLAVASVAPSAITEKPTDTIDMLTPEEALAAYEAEIARLRAARISGAPIDQLERMRTDLLRALTKPVAERRWVMVIDLRACVGCHGCTIACVAENKLPPGVVYRPVIEEEIGRYPNVSRRFIPRPCMQCDNPPCTGVCPVSAPLLMNTVSLKSTTSSALAAGLVLPPAPTEPAPSTLVIPTLQTPHQQR